MKDHTSTEFGSLFENTREVDKQVEEAKVEEDHGMENDGASHIDNFANVASFIMDDIKDAVIDALDELTAEGFSREEAGSWITGQVQDIVDRGSSKR